MAAALQAPEFEALCHIRNLIAHTGGTIDRDFLVKAEARPEVRAILADIVKLDIGGVPTIDGPFIRKHAYTALERGCNLIKKVDDWLIAH